MMFGQLSYRENLSISFTNKTHLQNLLDKTIFNNIKDQYGGPHSRGYLINIITRPFLRDTNDFLNARTFNPLFN